MLLAELAQPVGGSIRALVLVPRVRVSWYRQAKSEVAERCIVVERSTARLVGPLGVGSCDLD
jgi:hypothetical protein